MPLPTTFEPHLPRGFTSCSPAASVVSPDMHLLPTSHQLLPMSPFRVLQQVHPDSEITEDAHNLSVGMSARVLDKIVRLAFQIAELANKK